jgi:hypothetical protein
MIAQNMQPPQGAPAAPQAAQGGDPVQRIVTAALMLLNQDAFEKQIVDTIQSSQDPAQGVAQAFLLVLRVLHEKSKGLPMQALGQASQPILQEILKMAEAAHVVQMTPQFLQQVMQAVKAALSAQTGAAQPNPLGTTAPNAQDIGQEPAAPAQPQGV